MKAFRENDVDVVLHNAELMDGDEVIQCGATMFDYRGSRTGLFKNFVKNSYVGCCMAFRSRIRDVILPIPEEMYMHDYWIGTIGEKMGGCGLLNWRHRDLLELYIAMIREACAPDGIRVAYEARVQDGFDTVPVTVTLPHRLTEKPRSFYWTSVALCVSCKV